MDIVKAESKTYTKCIFSEDKKHRYMLYKEWSQEGRLATVILLNPSRANEVVCDLDTINVTDYMYKNGYRGVNIVNLFSVISDSEKDMIKEYPSYEDRYDSLTDSLIRRAIKTSEDIYLAWGSNNGRKTRIADLKEILKDNMEGHKIYRIVDGDSQKAKHISYIGKIDRQEIKHIDEI